MLARRSRIRMRAIPSEFLGHFLETIFGTFFGNYFGIIFFGKVLGHFFPLILGCWHAGLVYRGDHFRLNFWDIFGELFWHTFWKIIWEYFFLKLFGTLFLVDCWMLARRSHIRAASNSV